MPGETAPTTERPAPRVIPPGERPAAAQIIDIWVTQLGLDEEVDASGKRTTLQTSIMDHCFDDVDAAVAGLDEISDPDELAASIADLQQAFRNRIASTQIG